MIRADHDAGVGARSPFQVPASGWLAVMKRTWTETGDDNIGLIAAGVAFYAFAAIVPLLAAVVLSYGLFAAPETVQRNIQAIFSSMPREAAALATDQLLGVIRSSEGKKGVGLVVALAVAFYGATKGASAVITGLNVAYGVHESRGFVRTNLLYLSVVAGGVAMIFLAMLATALVAFLENLLPGAPGVVLLLLRLVGYLVLAALVVTAAAALYYVGPATAQPRWLWLSPGSLGATGLWLAGTALFGFYVTNFGNYGATYGSLSAVVVLLTWLWLSAYVFLLGAELNAELERQVEDDGAGDSALAAPDRTLAPAADITSATPAEASPLAAARNWGVFGDVVAPLLSGGVLAAAGMGMLRRGKPAGLAAVALATALAWRKGRVSSLERGEA